MKKLSRREFMRFAGLAAGATILTSCTTPQVITHVVTSVINETRVVKTIEVVSQTQIVEVTPTSSPNLVTIQGKVLPLDAAPLEQQVIFDSGSEPSHLDVARDLWTAGMVMNLGVEPLLRLDENQEIVPALAESWKAGDGVKFWEFTLRKDAKWSDGVAITADDWVFTFQHALDPRLGNGFAYFYYAIKGAAAYNSGQGTASDLGIVKVDSRTFQIWGEKPAPHIPAMLTYQAVAACPKHKAESNPEHWADTREGFVASGQYTLVKWEHNVQMIWQTHKYYNGPHKPGIQTVVQNMGTANTNWWNAFLNHEIDAFFYLNRAQIAQVRADPTLNPLLHWFAYPKTDYISFNINTEPYGNKDLRMALAKSIDRVALAQQVLQGTMLPAYSMLPPGFPAHNPDLKPIQEFNVATARTLLEKAGFKDGIDPKSHKPLKITITTREVNGNYAQFVQQQWQNNLGVEVILDQKVNAVWRDMRSKHKLDVFLNYNEFDFMDPANLLAAIWRSDAAQADGGGTQLPWHNDEFNQLCDEAGSEADPDKRVQTYQQAEKVLAEDAGGIFLLWTLIFEVWWPYVTGIKPNKAGNIEWRFMDISRFQVYIRNDVGKYRKTEI